MTYRERQRLADIQAAIGAIGSHLKRGDLSDGLILDAVRIRLLEIGEAVKALPAEMLSPSLPSLGPSREPADETAKEIASSPRSAAAPFTGTMA